MDKEKKFAQEKKDHIKDILNSKPNEEMETLKEENAKLKDQLLRALAEKDNILKREHKMKQDERDFAIKKFASDLLDGVENLHRTLDAMPKEAPSKEQEPIQKGIEMTLKSFMVAFDRNRLTRITPIEGDAFDHNFHQAMAQIPHPDFENGQIINIMQSGYQINDKLIRPAMVVVAANPANKEASTDENK